MEVCGRVLVQSSPKIYFWAFHVFHIVNILELHFSFCTSIPCLRHYLPHVFRISYKQEMLNIV